MLCTIPHIARYVFAALLLFSCGEKQRETENFHILGQVEGLENGEVSLVSYTGNGGEYVLATTDAKDGTFKLSGNIKSPLSATIVWKKYEIPLFVEVGEISLKADTTFYREVGEHTILDATINGSEINELYKLFNEQMNTLENQQDYNKADSLFTILSSQSLQDNSKAQNTLLDHLDSLLENSVKRENKIRMQFALEHANSILAPYVLLYEGDGFNDISFTIDEMDRVIEKLTPTLQKTDLYMDCVANYKGSKRMSIGNIAPDFDLPTPKGPNLQLKTYRGKYVFLDFWAYWCGPCTDNFPALKEIYETYGNEHFEIIGINDDSDEQAWLQALEEQSLQWPQVMVNCDMLNQMTVSELYNIDYLPTTYLLDENGIILYKNIDPQELNSILEEIFLDKNLSTN